MDWMDYACTLPFLIASVVGVLVSISKLSTHRAAATLAACGFGISLVQMYAWPLLYKAIGAVIEDHTIVRRITTFVSSCGSAIHVALLLMAVFVARRANASVMDTSSEDIAFAKDQLSQGASHEQIEEALADRGLDHSAIASVMAQIEVLAAHKAGWWNLIFGGVICAVGVFVTVASFMFAANAPGGGRVIIAYGLVFAGGAQMIRGLSQLAK